MKITAVFVFPWLITLFAAAQATPHAKREPLAAYLGHWETSGKFYETKFSKPHAVTSSLDCSWSPQGSYMTCEQVIHDDQGEHTQLTLYTPNPDYPDFTFYTFNTPGQKPWMGSLKIEGDTWTYLPPRDAADKYPIFRTTNWIKDGKVTYKVEFAKEPGKWTTISERSSRRTK